mmetsp:Transcript_5162/g.4377  ORF Transcript_5162/g.4377 Transcript_5162/m.4377 type:complete len:136 (-) Transcript_5162:1085-1492(-)
MLSDVFSLIGVCLTLVDNFVAFLIGRVITGFALGINFGLVAVYVVEISPMPLRGSLGSLPVFFMAIGTTFSYALAYTMPSTINDGEEDNTWRILLAIPGIIFLARFFIFLFFFKYDTPISYFLVHNDKEKAKECL